MTKDIDLTTTLADVLGAYATARDKIQAKCDTDLAEITRKESLIRDALSGGGIDITSLIGDVTSTSTSNGSTSSNGSESSEPGTYHGNGGYQLGIADDKYNKVIEYLRKHGPTRQADLAKSLKLNSGSVSVAMQIAQRRGEATLAGRKDGAKLWEPTEQTTKSSRETVVKPGQGVSKGRKVAA